MKKPQFENGEFYHVYNRGVEKRSISMNDADRYRFLRSLYFCNDEAPTTNSYRTKDELCEMTSRTVKRLVNIHAFILMPNHYHLLLEQVVDEGISRFIQKLGIGYTSYFNLKHHRVGPLFQGTFKAVLVDDDSQFEYLPYYIHANALDLYDKKWREGKLRNFREALNFLEQYKWSSHLDYLGIDNYSSIIEVKLLRETLGNPMTYKKDFTDWLKDQAIETCEAVEFE